MAIDSSHSTAGFGNLQRIDAIRRVERDSASRQSGENEGRRRQDAESEQSRASDIPLDIVELSGATTIVEPVDHPPSLRQPSILPVDAERHLDIKV